MEYFGREREIRMAIIKRSRNKVIFFSIFILFVSILICLFAFDVFAASNENETLLHLTVLFRHGARTPTDTYNNDPYKDYPWPNGRGSLTKDGMLQLYELGKLLRKRYKHFIPAEYFDKDVYALSSDNPRCLMSAYTMLAGLYPPTEKQRWHQDIPWQPIPVHAIPRLMDNIIASKKPCTKLNNEYDLARKSERIKKLDENLKELYEYLTLHTGGAVDNILTLEYLYSTLLVENELGLRLPAWAESVFPNKMEYPMRSSLALFTDNDLMKRLRSGPFIKEITDNMKHTDKGTMTPRFNFYSAHDITIVGAWRTLGFNELLRPAYGASLIIELHRDVPGNPNFVKAFYWNSTNLSEPLELKLPLCDTPCSLSKFEESMKHLMPDDWETECENKS